MSRHVWEPATDETQPRRRAVRPTIIGLFDERAEAMRAYDEYAGDFRDYYTQRLARSGLAYERYSPAFRYGFSLAINEPFRSWSWATIEPDARRPWMVMI